MNSQDPSVAALLLQVAKRHSVNLLSDDFAKLMDEEDPLAHFREKFCYPKKKNLPQIGSDLTSDQLDEECIYLCGNSLGLKPKSVDKLIQDQLDKWGKMGVHLHFEDPLPAASCEDYGRESMGRLVGADASSVILLNGLTVNLHLLLISFYQPTKLRHKIVIEDHAFPSDRYAMRSQIKMRGYDPDESLVILKAREGEDVIRTEDILKVLDAEGESIAVVCLSGINYYTGQKFDMKTITQHAQKKGCLVGWDLAHAVGNVEICLDDWNVDFACWCTYKYLNSGAGCIGGGYVNKRHNNRDKQLKGWFGNKTSTRFQMNDQFDSALGIDGFKLSNCSPMSVAFVMASLEIFDEATMAKILEKQRLLTGYLEFLLLECFENSKPSIGKILTPTDPNARGSQLSIQFYGSLEIVFEELTKIGVVCDIRKPYVLRIAPAPLYNSFSDVKMFFNTLIDLLGDPGKMFRITNTSG